MMNIEFFKKEIRRAYRVLGRYRAAAQVVNDISGWKQDGYITEAEADELHTYSRGCFMARKLR